MSTLAVRSHWTLEFCLSFIDVLLACRSTRLSVLLKVIKHKDMFLSQKPFSLAIDRAGKCHTVKFSKNRVIKTSGPWEWVLNTEMRWSCLPGWHGILGFGPAQFCNRAARPIHAGLPTGRHICRCRPMMLHVKLLQKHQVKKRIKNKLKLPQTQIMNVKTRLGFFANECTDGNNCKSK